MVGKGTVAVLVGVVLAGCSTQAAAPARQSVQAVVPTATQAPTPPASGPVPAQLLVDWFMPEAAVLAINPPATGSPCPQPLSAATCYFQLTFTSTSYHVYIGKQVQAAAGSVAANNNEIDFFNGANCDGVGRYTWTLTRNKLLFTLISDPCGRGDVLTYEDWSRTH